MTFRPLRGSLTPRADGAAQDNPHMGDEEREAGALAERVKNLEEKVRELAIELGKYQSDQMNVKTELAAEKGRKTLQTIIYTVWPVVVGLIVVVVFFAVLYR